MIALLHELTQLDYIVSFAPDFEGMMRIEFRKEYEDYYHHQHVGYPDCPMDKLEQKIIEALEHFKNNAPEESKI